MKTIPFDIEKWRSGYKAVLAGKEIDLVEENYHGIIGRTILNHGDMDWFIDGTPKNFFMQKGSGNLELIEPE